MPRKKAALKLDRLKERAAETFQPEHSYEQDVIQNLRLLPLEDILERPGGDTRGLNEAHVDELVASILVLGLITPLTVDREGHLLAGGHRRAALYVIQGDYGDRYEELFPAGIPVRVVDIDAAVDEVDALQIEVEENTQRRNFTAAEIREAALKLEDAGYKRLRGRPKSGEKSLKRELAKVFRLSDDRIQRILNDSVQKGRRTPTFSCDTAIATLDKWMRQIEKAESEEYETIQRRMKSLRKELNKIVEAEDLI